MSTFREIALAKIEEARDELAADGLLDDRAGALAGAMVDAATIAVQDWLREFRDASVTYTREIQMDGLIHEAGRVEVPQ